MSLITLDILSGIKNLPVFHNTAQRQVFASLGISVYQSNKIDMTDRMVKRNSQH